MMVLSWRNTLLREVKSYINNNLNPEKVIVIDPTRQLYSTTEYQIRNFKG